jgi:hypothetical protein
MSQGLLDHLQMRLLIELLVKHNDRPTPLQAVSGHLHLIHCVQVEDVEADGRAVGRLGGPEVKVVVLAAGFEEEGVVAVVEVAELVEGDHVVLVLKLRLCRAHRRSADGLIVELGGRKRFERRYDGRKREGKRGRGGRRRKGRRTLLGVREDGEDV